MKKIYRTMRGRPFDMQKFADQNGRTKAIGNTQMNARGDILGKLDEVKITREQIERHPNRIKQSNYNQVSLKDKLSADNFDTPEEILKKVNQTKRKESQFDVPKELQHRENKKRKLK